MSSKHRRNVGLSEPVCDRQGGLERDFKNWLLSLHSGDLQATHDAFTALKNEFQNLSTPRSKHPHDSILP